MAELELWPNWLRITARQGIPIAIINARLSARSLSGYLRIAPIITSVLSRVDWIGTQSATYRDRFLQLGYPNERIDVTGNIKFDGATPDREHPEVAMRRAMLSLNAPQEERERTVWLCGSTQSPEESLCLQAMSELLPRFPGLRMILVPRHAERFDEVAKLVEASGLPWIRRSQLTDAPTSTQWRVLLADSVGELRWWWGLADIGFVGGSFGSRGGQNMIEPCAYGVATSFGPNTRNFTDVVQLLLESDGAVQFQDPAQIVPWVTSMIENPSERQALQERAKELVQKQRGAVQRTWSQLKTLIASND
jgi:3-deoxy-D-manno-octulosonic-acid transferase